MILTVPVCARDTVTRLRAIADEVVCVQSPGDFNAVGRWYGTFDQTTDDEVVALLARSGATGTVEPSLLVERAVVVPQDDDVSVHADLTVPEHAIGVAVFAHGSGSSRRSSRNRRVATHLQAGGIATLLLDLLTEDEELADRRGESVPAVPVSDLHVGEHHVPGSTATMRHDSAPEPGRDKQAARSTFAGSTFQEKGTTFRCHRDEDGIEVWLTAAEDAPAGAPTGPAQVAARAGRDLAS